MPQLHKRFTTEQLKVLLKGYCQVTLDRPAIEEILGIGEVRFFVLLKQYRCSPEGFCLTYKRTAPTRLPAWVEKEEVITTVIGALIQHDASHPRWSPYARERWVLVVSLDDFSRKILYILTYLNGKRPGLTSSHRGFNTHLRDSPFFRLLSKAL